MERPTKRPRRSEEKDKIDSDPLKFRRDDHETYRYTAVSFSKPAHICDVSRNSKGIYFSDDSEMVKFVPPKKDCDLNLGFETWKHEELGRAELTFEPVMRSVAEKVQKEGMPKPKVHFVTWRGNLTKLLCAPYGGRDDWEMSVYCKKGVIYVDARETAACQMRKQTMDSKQRLWTYYGYKFEHYCTGVEDSVPVDTCPGANYNAVRRVGIGGLRLLICGEVDCYSGTPATENFMELKTSKLITDERSKNSFEKHKLMKFWAQSFTIGVPRVVVGFRDENGIVKKLQRFYTLKIPTLIAGRERELWDSKVCINFMHKLLVWIYETVSGTKTPWLLRYNGHDSPYIELIPNVERKKHCLFDEKYYRFVDSYPTPKEVGSSSGKETRKE